MVATNKSIMETSMSNTAQQGQGTEQQGPQESRVFAPPAEFVAQATVAGMAAYDALCAEAAADYEGFWPPGARKPGLAKAVHQDPQRRRRAVLQVVRGRPPERLLQLPGPQPRQRQRRQDRDHLRGR